MAVTLKDGGRAYGELLALDPKGVRIDPEGPVQYRLIPLQEVATVETLEDKPELLYPVQAGGVVAKRLRGRRRTRFGRREAVLGGNVHWTHRRPVSILDIRLATGDSTSVPSIPVSTRLLEGQGVAGSVSALFPVGSSRVWLGLEVEAARADADWLLTAEGFGRTSTIAGSAVSGFAAMVLRFPVLEGETATLALRLGVGLCRLSGTYEDGTFEETHEAFTASLEPEYMVARNVSLHGTARLWNTQIADWPFLDDQGRLRYLDIPRFTILEFRLGLGVYL